MHIRTKASYERKLVISLGELHCRAMFLTTSLAAAVLLLRDVHASTINNWIHVNNACLVHYCLQHTAVCQLGNTAAANSQWFPFTTAAI